MSDIIFVRHAETDMAGTFCGHSDPEVNSSGYAQIALLIKMLRGCNVGAVYTSDLRRAYSTARALADAFDVECHLCSALREIHFGDWEGLTWGVIEEAQEEFAERWLTAFPELPAPGGEDVNDFERRVLDAIEWIATKASDREVVVVTHAGVIRTVLRKLQGYSEEEAWEQTSAYCCIVRHKTAAVNSLQTDEASL